MFPALDTGHKSDMRVPFGNRAPNFVSVTPGYFAAPRLKMRDHMKPGLRGRY